MARSDRDARPATETPQFHSEEEIANSPEIRDKTRPTQGSDPHSRSYWTDNDRPGRTDPGLRYGGDESPPDRPARS